VVFNLRPLTFSPVSPIGQHQGTDDDEGDGLSKPLTAKAQARRMAGIAEAKEVLQHLPNSGESLHAVVSARLDLVDILGCILERLGHCSRMTVTTLGYSRRNVRTLLGWLDEGKVGVLSLVASIFFKSHNGPLWQDTLTEFHKRGQRAVCCDSHCKVVAMTFAGGERLSLEGSANLRSNGSAREQFVLTHDDALTTWNERWILDLLSTAHEHQAEGD
jgi:hypothetical protein